MPSRPAPAPLTEQEARQKVKAMKEFYGNLLAFVLVIPALIGINLWSDPSFLWFFFPLLGWGAGLGAQYVQTFGLPGRLGDWEERTVRDLMGHTVTHDEVRALVHEELDTLRSPRSPADLDRLAQRVEHLEAIVTSRDWDLLDESNRLDVPTDAPREEQTARLARRVR